jgi:amino acid transporter
VKLLALMAAGGGRSPTRQLQRTISLTSGIAFIVGAIIGSGIFASPGAVLLYSGSIGGSLLAWLVAGIIAILGAACYAELGARAGLVRIGLLFFGDLCMLEVRI